MRTETGEMMALTGDSRGSIATPAGAIPVIARTAATGNAITAADAASAIETSFPAQLYAGKRLLCIVPDGTRTCPLGLVFSALHAQLGEMTTALDVIIALGTHQPMSEAAICERLEITEEERRTTYARVRFFNHEWNNPAALREIGELTLEDTRALTEGRFEMHVPVKINARVFDYDELLIIGPVFPHEVVGFSGGNKYLFPGIGGPEVLNFFHWLGALVTNPMIIGNKWTPVRRVVDRVGGMVPVPKRCLAMVVDPAARDGRKNELAGLFIGTPEGAWDAASDLSRQLHVTYCERPFHTVLSVCPPMYDELWVGGKCMYKLEPVVADGGELIIYAPHIREISATHGHLIRQIGYHCRDYFLGQWEKFKDVPWSTIAHSTHVRGIGTYENGVEHCRVQVTLASAIPEEECRAVNLGYRDPATIRVEDYAGREDEGILYVPKAGEMLYHLRERPAWAQEM